MRLDRIACDERLGGCSGITAGARRRESGVATGKRRDRVIVQGGHYPPSRIQLPSRLPCDKPHAVLNKHTKPVIGSDLTTPNPLKPHEIVFALPLAVVSQLIAIKRRVPLTDSNKLALITAANQSTWATPILSRSSEIASLGGFKKATHDVFRCSASGISWLAAANSIPREAQA